MKRLLLSLLSLSFFTGNLSAMEKPEPLQINASQILREYNLKEKRYYSLHVLQSTASLLCAQDELAKAIKIHKWHEEKRNAAYKGQYDRKKKLEEERQLIVESVPKNYSDLNAKLLLKRYAHLATCPEVIAYILNLAEILNSEKNESINWEPIQEATQSDNANIAEIARMLLTRKEYWNLNRTVFHSYRTKEKIFKSMLRTARTHLTEKKYEAYLKSIRDRFDHNDTMHVQFKKCIHALRIKYSTRSQEELDNFLLPAPPLIDISTFLTGKILPEITSLDGYIIEKNSDLDAIFLENYSKMRTDCCKLYKAFRSALGQATIATGLDEQETKKHVSKIYNPDSLLPRELPASIEPIEEEQATIMPAPELPKEEASLASPVVSKSKKANKKQQKQTPKNHDHIAPAPAIAAPPVAQSVAAPIAKKPASQNFIKEIQDHMNHMSIHLYCSCKQKKEVPTFARHARINQWFSDSENALKIQGYLDPHNPKHKFIDTAIPYHSFSWDVDRIAEKYGTQYEQVNREGKRTLFVALPGHIAKNGQITFGIFGYAIDPVDKICYHRCFEPKTAQELLHEYLNEAVWKVTLEDLTEA